MKNSSDSSLTLNLKPQENLMKMPDPMIPCKPGAEDTEAMSNRVSWLEELYVRDGRNDSSHPQRYTYTGLYLKYRGENN